MKITPEQIREGSVHLHAPPMGEEYDKRWQDGAESAEKAKYIRAGNAAAERAALNPNYKHGPYNRGVVVLLPDGSAASITAAHLNIMVAFAPPAESYPREVYGLPVIAIGLRQ